MSTRSDDKKLARADNARNLVESNLFNIAVSSTSDVLFTSPSVLAPFAPCSPITATMISTCLMSASRCTNCCVHITTRSRTVPSILMSKSFRTWKCSNERHLHLKSSLQFFQESLCKFCLQHRPRRRHNAGTYIFGIRLTSWYVVHASFEFLSQCLCILLCVPCLGSVLVL